MNPSPHHDNRGDGVAGLVVLLPLEDEGVVVVVVVENEKNEGGE